MSDYGIRSILQSLPEDMDETYERIITMINQKRRPQRILAWKTLMWIAYAQRPLTEEEIVTAVAIEKNIVDLGTFRSMLPTAETLLAACINLVTIDGNRRVRFVHFSVQEFLLSGRSEIVHRLEVLRPKMAHYELAQNCITFIRLQLRSISARLGLYYNPDLPALLQYAMTYWHYHCRALPAHCLVTDEMFTLITSFFKFGPLLYWDGGGRGVRVKHYTNCVFSPSTLSLIFGLPSLARSFSEKQSHRIAIGQPYAHYVNEDLAMHFAVARDSELAVKHLIQAGHSINARQIRPLMLARSAKMATLLVEKNADVNAQGGEYGNALQAAATRSNEGIVALLLEKGANVNAQGGEYGNALQAAATGPHEGIVALLLENGADVNALGENALRSAAKAGSMQLVNLLAEHGACVKDDPDGLVTEFELPHDWSIIESDTVPP